MQTISCSELQAILLSTKSVSECLRPIIHDISINYRSDFAIALSWIKSTSKTMVYIVTFLKFPVRSSFLYSSSNQAKRLFLRQRLISELCKLDYWF